MPQPSIPLKPPEDANGRHVPEITLFAGPSLGGIAPSEIAPVDVEILWMPPAERGSIARLSGLKGEPGCLAIVDSPLNGAAAVGHEEIREALDAGWQIWGLSGIGASRAYEMRMVGMRGFGKVYECFEKAEDFRDDEIAVLHQKDPPFMAFSEPLVQFREALTAWVEEGRLARELAESVYRELDELWYGDRTLPNLAVMLGRHARMGASEVGALLSDFERFRLQQFDVREFLVQKPWRHHLA